MASASFRVGRQMALSGNSKFDAFAIFCKVAVARGSTSPKALAELAKSSEPEILAAVIANPKAPVEVIEQLIEKAGWEITELAPSEKSCR